MNNLNNKDTSDKTTPKTPVLKQKGLQFKGIWNIQLFNAATGKKEFEHTQENLIVDNGIKTMCKGFGPSHFNVLHLGNPPVTSIIPITSIDTQLQLDINPNGWITTHTTLHPPNIPYGTFSFEKKATLQAADAVGILTESGLFSPDNVMFNHVLFNPPIEKTNQQTAFITVTISLLRI